MTRSSGKQCGNLDFSLLKTSKEKRDISSDSGCRNKTARARMKHAQNTGKMRSLTHSEDYRGADINITSLRLLSRYAQ